MRAVRIAAILAILLAAGGGAYWWMSAGEDGPKAFQGYVEGNLVYMAPEEGGRIESMAVEAGDDVPEGQLLFGLEMSMQVAQKNEAEARLAAGRSAAREISRRRCSDRSRSPCCAPRRSGRGASPILEERI